MQIVTQDGVFFLDENTGLWQGLFAETRLTDQNGSLGMNKVDSDFGGYREWDTQCVKRSSLSQVG